MVASTSSTSRNARSGKLSTGTRRTSTGKAAAGPRPARNHVRRRYHLHRGQRRAVCVHAGLQAARLVAEFLSQGLPRDLNLGTTAVSDFHGFDTILGFDLDRREFNWAMHLAAQDFRFRASTFDPRGEDGPLMLNKLHVNNVHCTKGGMYISGLRTGGMLLFNGREVQMSAELPAGSHNARPFRDGVLFNDADSGRFALRRARRGRRGSRHARPPLRSAQL